MNESVGFKYWTRKRKHSIIKCLVIGSAQRQGGKLMGNGHGGSRPGAGRPRKIVAPANRETLTEDQTNALNASQYVSSVMSHQVSYTLAFKELFWQRFMDGVPPRQIFRDAGLDPDMLGESRIDGFVTTLRK